MRIAPTFIVFFVSAPISIISRQTLCIEGVRREMNHPPPGIAPEQANLHQAALIACVQRSWVASRFPAQAHRWAVPQRLPSNSPITLAASTDYVAGLRMTQPTPSLRWQDMSLASAHFHVKHTVQARIVLTPTGSQSWRIDGKWPRGTEPSRKIPLGCRRKAPKRSLNGE